jgi:hypothetical protein
VCPDSKDLEDDDKSEHKQDQESNEAFEEMVSRWGITIPSETKKLEPLSIEVLVEEWCREQFKRPGDAVRALKEGGKHIEASTALFGYCYSCLSPSLFGQSLEECLEYELSQLKRYSDHELEAEHYQDQVNIYRDLISFRDEFSSEQVLYPEGQENRALKSHVEVLLAAGRTILVFSRSKKQYDPDLDELLENAYKTVKQGKVGKAENFSNKSFDNDGRHITGDVVGFLACLACSAVCYSLAHMAFEFRRDYDRDFETAFKTYVEGAKYMLKTGYGIDFFDELFAGEGYYQDGDERELGNAFWNAIDVWEQLKKKQEKVQNWQELHSYLLKLEDIMYEESLDAEIGCYPDGEPGFVYLPRQISFCDGKLSQEEIRQVIQQQRKDQHNQRLRNDFFEELWPYLEGTTKNCLIDAEYTWYDKPTKDSRISAFVDYSMALETELHAIIFQKPEVQKCIKMILKKQKNDNDYKKRMKLSSLEADSLYLSDMSKLLGYVRENWTDVIPVKKAISSLPIPEDMKVFLTQKRFTDDLGDIYQIRNRSVHRLPWQSVLLLRMSELRKKILGIGCEGYLIKLAEIKELLASRVGKPDYPGTGTV